jgi:hypothetical protein
MTEIIVAAPYCTPQRNAILSLLGSYGVTSARVIDAYCIYPDGARGPESGLGRDIPLRLIYHVRVRAQAATWAEYLLLRSQQFELLSRALDARNAQWAARWHGQLPKPWAVGPCAARQPAPVQPVKLKEDSAGYRLLRQLGRNNR